MNSAIGSTATVARDRLAETVIHTEGLSKHYVRGADTVRALDSVTLQLPRGCMIVLKGRSGCGKSTLLNLLGALDRPTAGSVVVDGVDVGRLSGPAEVQYRLRKVGIVFQSFNLVPQLTALENVMLPMEFAGRSRKAAEQRARHLLGEVGIESGRADHKPTRLSGGQQQRVAIARALANDPAVLLADEPTGNLDSEISARIIDLLRGLAGHRRTLIIATHDDEIASRADLVVTLRDGRMVDVAPPGPASGAVAADGPR